MQDYKIISDTSADLTLEEYAKLNVDIVPYYITFDGAKYYKDLQELSAETFYEMLVSGKNMPKTSMPNSADFQDFFRKYLNLGMDVILFTITSKFSSAYQNAVTAREMILEQYPDRKIFIVDSTLCTCAFGLLLRNAVAMKQSGASIEELYERMEEIKHTGLVTFSVDSLEHLQRGGRIGLVSGFLGGLLNIKPIIQMTDGELKPHSKVRGRKKALSAVIDIHLPTLNPPEDYDFCVIQTMAADEAAEFEKDFIARAGFKPTYPITHIGSTIGVHIGPGVVGISSVKKYNAK